MNSYNISKGALNEKSKKELIRIIDTFQKERDSLANALVELMIKNEKYRWHDLRKNPEDLPETSCEYECDVALKWDDGDITYDIQSDHIVPLNSPGEVIAWKYIEPFEEN